MCETSAQQSSSAAEMLYKALDQGLTWKGELAMEEFEEETVIIATPGTAPAPTEGEASVANPVMPPEGAGRVANPVMPPERIAKPENPVMPPERGSRPKNPVVTPEGVARPKNPVIPSEMDTQA